MNRYFLITYKATALNDDPVIGNLWFAFNGFPGNEFIKKQAGNETVKVKNVVITNIYEFENKQDFDQFKSDTA